MDVISNIPLIGGFLSTVIPFIAVLGVVVFVHEYGHYIVGRWCGISAEVFSVGFGPVIWSREDSRGTLWQLAAIPLGGYVKFLGDSDGSSRVSSDSFDQMDASERAHSFHGSAVWKRMLTVLAGPAANFLLTIVVFAGLVTWQGISSPDAVIGQVDSAHVGPQSLRTGDLVVEANGQDIDSFEGFLLAALDMDTPGPLDLLVEREGQAMRFDAPYPFPPLVGSVVPLSPASKAGLMQGDLIVAADGTELVAFEDLRSVVMASGDTAIPLQVLRDSQEISLEITPKEQDIESGDGGFEKRVMIGVTSAPLYLPATTTPAPWTAVSIGVQRLVGVITQSLNGLKHMIIGNISAENLQGPLGIAQISGASAQQGFVSFLVLIGVISAAIGMLNLFPIPVLDGGHFVIFLVEAVRGKPPGPAVMQIVTSIGLGLVLLLMVFATYNDILRWVS